MEACHWMDRFSHTTDVFMCHQSMANRTCYSQSVAIVTRVVTLRLVLGGPNFTLLYTLAAYTQHPSSGSIYTAPTLWQHLHSTHPLAAFTQHPPSGSIYTAPTLWQHLHSTHPLAAVTQHPSSGSIYTAPTLWQHLHSTHPLAAFTQHPPSGSSYTAPIHPHDKLRLDCREHVPYLGQRLLQQTLRLL